MGASGPLEKQKTSHLALSFLPGLFLPGSFLPSLFLPSLFLPSLFFPGQPACLATNQLEKISRTATIVNIASKS